MRNHSVRYLTESRHVNEKICLYGMFSAAKYRTPDAICSIDMVPTDRYVCKVTCDGQNVFAAHKFNKFDIIELCPCRIIDKSALYSKDIRDIVFEVVPNEKYVIPMGYCQYYDVTDSFEKEPNCDYEWDANKECITIRALKKIAKGDKLIIDIRPESER